METYELLVKLASIGTAGVCILAIFIIGTSIMRLKSDTPDWKVSLMKKYMNTCVIIAVICTISGGANAYFNQDKIKTANNEAAEATEKSNLATTAFLKLEENYDRVSEEANRYKEEVRHQMLQIENQLDQRDIERGSIEGINVIKGYTNEFKVLPKEQVLRGIDTNRIREFK